MRMMTKRKPIAKTLVPDFERDIKEWYIRERMPEVLDVLLIDRTTGKNIMWGTKDYESRGKGFGEWDEIKADLIANKNDKVIVPRVCKSKDEQRRRVLSENDTAIRAVVFDRGHGRGVTFDCFDAHFDFTDAVFSGDFIHVEGEFAVFLAHPDAFGKLPQREHGFRIDVEIRFHGSHFISPGFGGVRDVEMNDKLLRPVRDLLRRT